MVGVGDNVYLRCVIDDIFHPQDIILYGCKRSAPGIILKKDRATIMDVSTDVQEIDVDVRLIDLFSEQLNRYQYWFDAPERNSIDAKCFLLQNHNDAIKKIKEICKAYYLKQASDEILGKIEPIMDNWHAGDAIMDAKCDIRNLLGGN